MLPLAQRVWPCSAIISPRGHVSEQGALRFFRRRAEGEYDFDDLQLRQKAMAEFVLTQKQRLSPIRTIGLGYSNGANILAAVAFAAPDLFDELVLMHPLISWTPPDQPGLAKARVLITAGRRDPICPPAQTLALERYFERQCSSFRASLPANGSAGQGKPKALTINRYLPVSLRFHSLSSRSTAMVVTCSRALRRLQE